mmetsp:Transcript_18382/g.62548  ORF Transcript_18382/g.62548 Transcript_18382/m.62548 type:complete len:304 (+) Transcript_18382:898-1809(+)
MSCLPSHGLDSTFSTIWCVTSNELFSGSGMPPCMSSNVCLFQFTKFLGGFFLVSFLPFPLPAFAAFSSMRLFSTQCSGAWHHTYPWLSKPLLPARPAICRNSRLFSSRVSVPSNLYSCVSRTVRMGTFTPTPRVSVPHITFSSPRPASFSTSRRYLGSMPAWCTPTPKLSMRRSSCPTGVSKRALDSSFASFAFSSLLRKLMDVRSCAFSFAAFCVKCTRYTGALPVSSSSSTLCCSPVSLYSNSSGTGRSPPATTAVDRPVFSARDSSNVAVGPNVALISRNCALGSSSRGTCHAQPRSSSA